MPYEYPPPNPHDELVDPKCPEDPYFEDAYEDDPHDPEDP